VVKPEVDVALLRYDILDDEVCAAVESVGCLKEEDSACSLCEGEDRGPETDICCLDESEALRSACFLEF
jgi:hypothetical protein